MTLFELQAWLGHRSPLSTQHYARITPTTLTKAYHDAGYFARVFKQHCGESPLGFRARLDARRTEKEDRPKTIYYDREDYTAGKPAPTAAPGGAAAN